MLIGITNDGIGNVGSLENQIKLAAKYNFQVVDTTGDALRELIKEKGKKGAKNFLAKQKIRISALQFPVQWQETDEKFYDSIPQLIQDVQLAHDFEIGVFNTFFWPSTDNNPIAHFMKLTNRIRACASLIKNYNCKIALEFVGPLHLRHKYENVFIHNLQDTLAWIDMIGENNVGVLLDSIHWYTTSGTEEELLAIDPTKIIHVHINDAPNIPIDKVKDNDRLYPTEGVIDLKKFLTALNKIKYNGAITQEVLSTKPLLESSEELVKKSSELLHDLIKNL